MKIAVVHDWFKANGGAEKVAGEILATYHEDDVEVYTLFNKFKEADKEEILKQYKIHVSVLQYVPAIAKIYRFLFPLMPFIIEHFRIKNKDVILSTSHAVAKAIGCDSNILNICYCHSPMRYAWDMYDDYLADHNIADNWLYAKFIATMRAWDYKTASKVHYFIANSIHIQKRIKNSYGRDAVVIYPPVRVHQFNLYIQPREDYYLCLGRFVPYKKIDLIIKAFQQMPTKKLKLIGDGYATKDFDELIGNYDNIEWLGYQKDAAMIQYMQHAKACIFAAKEDFGIMCVEVQACGTPVIALDYGGYQETVVNGQTGYLFAHQTEDSIIEAIIKFEEHPLTDYQAIRNNALRFSDQRFRDEIKQYVQQCYLEYYKRPIDAIV